MSTDILHFEACHIDRYFACLESGHEQDVFIDLILHLLTCRIDISAVFYMDICFDHQTVVSDSDDNSLGKR